MRSILSHRDRLIGVLFVFSWLFLATGTWAQTFRRGDRDRSLLGRASGGTALSYKIHSEAAYMVGQGSMIKSIAIARKIHADAYAKEIENSIAYVDAYFRRQEINRIERAKKDPRYLEREKIAKDAQKLKLDQQLQSVRRGKELAPELNWLLVELSGPAQSLGYLTSEAARAAEDPGSNISEADAALIRFGDGRVSFSAKDPRLLEIRWPFTLRTERFSPLRKDFISTREAVLEEIGSEGLASHESGSRLIGSVDGLMVGLEQAYPREERIKPTVYPEYHAAKRYLGSLAREVYQTVHNGDESLFDKSLGFEGGSVVELIWHMDRKGLIFTETSAGGRRVYLSLLNSMRNLYLAQAE